MQPPLRTGSEPQRRGLQGPIPRRATASRPGPPFPRTDRPRSPPASSAVSARIHACTTHRLRRDHPARVSAADKVGARSGCGHRASVTDRRPRNAVGYTSRPTSLWSRPWSQVCPAICLIRGSGRLWIGTFFLIFAETPHGRPKKDQALDRPPNGWNSLGLAEARRPSPRVCFRHFLGRRFVGVRRSGQEGYDVVGVTLQPTTTARFAGEKERLPGRHPRAAVPDDGLSAYVSRPREHVPQR